MSSLQQQILDQIGTLKDGLASLAKLVAHPAAPVSDGSPSSTGSAAAPPPAPPRARRAKAPNTWSYLPDATYGVTGANPFRAGNSRALFDHLVSTYQREPFTRVQLGDAIKHLKLTGAINSKMDEQLFVIGFLRTAGAEKGRMRMLSAPTPPDAPKRRRAAETGA